jgi:Tfp pilus assembly pilus retraction ATPase PilT
MNPQDLLQNILTISGEKNYSDIHLNTGNKPLVRDTNGNINILNDSYGVLTKDFILQVIQLLV